MLENFKDRDNLGILIITNRLTNEANVFYRGLLEVQYDVGGQENKNDSTSKFYFLEMEMKKTDKLVVYDIDNKEVGYLNKEDYDRRIESIPTNLKIDYPNFSWDIRGDSLNSTKFKLTIEDTVNGVEEIEIDKTDCRVSGNKVTYTYDNGLVVGDRVRFRVRGLNKNTDTANYCDWYIVTLKEIRINWQLDRNTYILTGNLNTSSLEFEWFINDISQGTKKDATFSFELVKNTQYRIKIICNNKEKEESYTAPVDEPNSNIKLDSVLYRKLIFQITNNEKWKYYLSNDTSDKFLEIVNNEVSFVTDEIGTMKKFYLYSVKTQQSTPSAIRTDDLKLTNSFENIETTDFPEIKYTVDDTEYGKLKFTFELSEDFVIQYKKVGDPKWNTSIQTINNEITLENLDYGEEYEIQINQLRFDVYVPQDSVSTKDLPIPDITYELGFYMSINIVNNNTQFDFKIDIDKDKIFLEQDNFSSKFYLFDDLTFNTENKIKVYYTLDGKRGKSEFEIPEKIFKNKTLDFELTNEYVKIPEFKSLQDERLDVNLLISSQDIYVYYDSETGEIIPENSYSEEITESKQINFSELQIETLIKNNIAVILQYSHTLFKSSYSIKEWIRIPRAWVLGQSEIGYSTYLVDREIDEKPIVPSLPSNPSVLNVETVKLELERYDVTVVKNSFVEVNIIETDASLLSFLPSQICFIDFIKDDDTEKYTKIKITGMSNGEGTVRIFGEADNKNSVTKNLNVTVNNE